MRIIDMHCDTLIEGWRKPERSFYDGETSINLKLLKENGSLVQFFAMYLSRQEMKTMDPYDILKGIYRQFMTTAPSTTDVMIPAMPPASISILSYTDQQQRTNTTLAITDLFMLAAMLSYLFPRNNSFAIPCTSFFLF